jgi:hypothetical protein
VAEGQAPHRRTIRSRRAHWAAGLLILLWAGAAPAESPCAPWPDEPHPLPRRDDPDPLRARWAALRLRELDGAAQRLEALEPARARLFWTHALCIAPNDARALRGLAEPNAPVTVHRPEVLQGSAEAPAPNAWASLDETILVVPAVRRAAPRRPDPAAAQLDQLVEETANLVRAARFEDALVSAERARKQAATLPREVRAGRSATLEVWAATAALALGRESEARDGLNRALAANPGLSLDEGTTSPKVRQALESVRAEQQP